MNPHHVDNSKKLDDSIPTKNGRKDSKVIAGLIMNGGISKIISANKMMIVKFIACKGDLWFLIGTKLF
jgi:hypothetical protein